MVIFRNLYKINMTVIEFKKKNAPGMTADEEILFPAICLIFFLSFCRSSAWVMTTNTTAAKVYLPIAPASRWRTWKLISRTLWRLQPEPTQGWDSGARNMSSVKLSQNIVTAPLTISFIFVFVSIVYCILSEFHWEFSISYILDPQNFPIPASV